MARSMGRELPTELWAVEVVQTTFPANPYHDVREDGSSVVTYYLGPYDKKRTAEQQATKIVKASPFTWYTGTQVPFTPHVDTSVARVIPGNVSWGLAP